MSNLQPNPEQFGPAIAGPVEGIDLSYVVTDTEDRQSPYITANSLVWSAAGIAQIALGYKIFQNPDADFGDYVGSSFAFMVGAGANLFTIKGAMRFIADKTKVGGAVRACLQDTAKLTRESRERSRVTEKQVL